MVKLSNIVFYSLLFFAAVTFAGCDYATHRTLSKDYQPAAEEPDPNYDVSLEYNYQDFISFMFLGNRSESFSTYFNKFFTANEDYDEALKEYKASIIASYNRRLDSLNIVTPVLPTTIEKFTKVIERCSKVIQYNKNTKYFDDAVLLIGLSYYYSNDFLQAERKFNEFLSKLTKSDLADEAILYLGMTKIRLRSFSDGETILKSLLQSANKPEIKAQALMQLSIYYFGLKNYTDAQSFLIQSIELTKDKELKAEREYLLAKMYSLYNKKDAPKMFENAFKNTSDFDFEFYAKLNEGKAYNENGDYVKALEIFKRMDKKYIDYPDFKQYVDLELANTDFFQKKYTEAKTKYFDIIVKNPGIKAVAESYYKLGVYYETSQNNYLNALISYKKAFETSPAIDYADLCKKKAEVLDRYFSLQAIIHDTTKIEIPAEELELKKYREDYEKELNIDLKNPIDPKNPPKGVETPKGGGYSSRDTIPENDSLLKAFQKILNEKGKENINSDTIISKNTKDTIVKGNDSLINIVKKDSVFVPVVNLDSLKDAKEFIKMNAYFELAEIFYYNLNHRDSAVNYLNKIIIDNSNSNIMSKALFYLGSIYKSEGNNIKAAEYFNDVITRFPNSIYANESRKYLGLETVLQNFDSADSLISIADKLLTTNNKDKITSVIYEAIAKYPESPLMPKAYYTLGWLYEYVQPNKDSAMKYFAVVINNYPNTEYANSLRSKYAYYESLIKKDTVSRNDSSGVNDSTMIAGDSTTIKIPDNLNDSLKSKKQNNSGDDNSKTPDKKDKKGREEPPKELIKPKEDNRK